MVLAEACKPRQVHVRQCPAADHVQPGRRHHDADNQIDERVEPVEGEPMRQPEMGQFARQRLLRGERQRED